MRRHQGGFCGRRCGRRCKCYDTRMSPKSQRNTTQNKHKPLTTQPCTCCEPTKVLDKLHMHHETAKLIGQRHQKGNVRNTTTRTPAIIRMGLLPAESQRAGFHQPCLCWDHSIACAPESTTRKWRYIDETQSAKFYGEDQTICHLPCCRLLDDRCILEDQAIHILL